MEEFLSLFLSLFVSLPNFLPPLNHLILYTVPPLKLYICLYFGSIIYFSFYVRISYAAFLSLRLSNHPFCHLSPSLSLLICFFLYFTSPRFSYLTIISTHYSILSSLSCLEYVSLFFLILDPTFFRRFKKICCDSHIMFVTFSNFTQGNSLGTEDILSN